MDDRSFEPIAEIFHREVLAQIRLVGDVTDEQQRAVESTLQDLRDRGVVADVRYESREAKRERFRVQFAAQPAFVNHVPDSALLATYELTLPDPDCADLLVDAFLVAADAPPRPQYLPGVESIVAPTDFLRRLAIATQGVVDGAIGLTDFRNPDRADTSIDGYERLLGRAPDQ